MDDRSPYPVRVDAHPDAALSRWLWLVKWLLLVPHAIALLLLWAAAAVVWLAAGVAILATGRYPASLFDFEVGVLRWTWRVHHYGYGALGTDRYPPFTLAEVADYPAHLEVDRPERLSRGLWLVKWLLAVPHLLVVGVFVGGGLWVAGRTGTDGARWGPGGLISLLVLVAAIVLLVRGRYPAGIYDLVLGLDRWVLRVAAYLLLTTDRYPPFRLDSGGTDPGSAPAPPAGPVPTGGSTWGRPPLSPARRPGWTAGRVVALVVGCLMLLGSTAPLVGGGLLLWADRTQREDGYLLSGATTVSTTGYALVARDVRLDIVGNPVDLAAALGDTRVEATSASADELFVGIAPTPVVAEYLAGVARRSMSWTAPQGSSWGTGWGTGPGMMSGTAGVGGPGTEIDGGPPPGAPTAPGESWTASATGSGRVVLDWTPVAGDWSVVVMHADGGPGVTAAVRIGATAPSLPWLAGAALGLGVLLFLVGALLVLLAVRAAGPASAGGGPDPGGTLPATPVPPGPVPAAAP